MAEFARYVFEEWQKIVADLLNSLIYSMWDCCIEVLQKNGAKKELDRLYFHMARTGRIFLSRSDQLTWSTLAPRIQEASAAPSNFGLSYGFHLRKVCSLSPRYPVIF